MTEHAIKIKKKYFKAVLSGEKNFEIRKNDRDYQVGDIIHFVPVDDECGMIIPHNPNAYKITYVFHGGEYGLEEGYCVFGIIPEAYDKEIRAKVIDEFAGKIELEISESIIWDMLATMSENGSLSDTSDKIVDYVIDTAKRIAEQMKGVG